MLAYLEEERALVLSLRAGRPEPVGQRSSLGGGDEVAQGHRLLQDVQSLLVGLHPVCTLTLQDDADGINQRNKTSTARVLNLKGFEIYFLQCYLYSVYS